MSKATSPNSGRLTHVLKIIVSKVERGSYEELKALQVFKEEELPGRPWGQRRLLHPGSTAPTSLIGEGGMCTKLVAMLLRLGQLRGRGQATFQYRLPLDAPATQLGPHALVGSRSERIPSECMQRIHVPRRPRYQPRHDAAPFSRGLVPRRLVVREPVRIDRERPDVPRDVGVVAEHRQGIAASFEAFELDVDVERRDDFGEEGGRLRSRRERAPEAGRVGTHRHSEMQAVGFRREMVRNLEEDLSRHRLYYSRG